MRTRFHGRGLSALVLTAFVFLAAPRPGVAQAAGDACRLVTPAEMQSLLGAPVTLQPQKLGDVQACSAGPPAVRATIRLFKRTSDASDDKEKASIETAKKMGFQIDVTNANGIMCVTMVPPASMAQVGVTTSCTVTTKASITAVIEIAAKEKKDMVPSATLRSLAAKMATRF